MRVLNISISDSEFDQLGLKEDSLAFSDFIDLVISEIARKKLKRSTEFAEKYGISSMTMDEISNEVKSVRANAKGHN